MGDVVTIETPGLGDRSYLVTDGRCALVVDPQRDIDRVLALARERGVPITHVLETHVHNDYVTGGYQLARRVGAAYVLCAQDDVEFERTGVRDGDVVDVSPRLRVRVVATPGHTFTHLSYVLEEPAAVLGEPPDGRPGEDVAWVPVAVFTGGSLLYGSTGRPDLLGPEHAEALAREQHASVHRLVRDLPEGTPVYPTHGFGSFCTAGPAASGDEVSTIGQEAARNPALTSGVEEFVEATLAGLDDYPAYYAHMAPLNAAGPADVDLSPPHRADAAELRRRLAAGEWVVDLRTRTAFAAGHVRGTYNFGTDGKWVSHLGWLVPWGTPLTLLASTAEDIAHAQRELVRIGIDRPAAAAPGAPQEWAGPDGLERTRLADFPTLRATLEAHDGGPGRARVVVLDVRRRGEWRAAHLSGAAHVPLHELLGRLGDVPPGEVWVHCRSGFRASVAGSLLQAAGRDVVVIDDALDHAEEAGLVLVRPAS